MKQVLFVTTNPELGGAQKWTFDQITLLQDYYDVYLATGNKGWLSDISKDVCLEILLDNGLHSFTSLGYLFRLRKFVKRNQIDLVIASSANAGIYARMLKLLIPSLGVVYVSHGWSAIYRGNRFYQWVEKGLSYLSSSILVVSHSDYDKAIDILHISPKKVKLIENSIFPFPKKSCDKKVVENSRLQIVMVARFDIPKRQDLLIAAAKDLMHMDFHFVGEGSQLNVLQKNAPSNTIFWGALDDVAEVLQKADICVLLSDSEGMPLSVLEALSCAKPLLLSRISSMHTFIKDNGVLVKNTIEAIINGLIELENSDLETLGKNSKRIFDARFNLEIKKLEYLDYYAELIKK
jgi:glycosyltransferase involved in cell wall biosynthesis